MAQILREADQVPVADGPDRIVSKGRYTVQFSEPGHAVHQRLVLQRAGQQLKRLPRLVQPPFRQTTLIQRVAAQQMLARGAGGPDAKLDASAELDDGNPVELGQEYRELKARLTNLSVYGGCCGTDRRHVDAIGKYCLA
ncbi:MAG: hypothetical protein AB7I68_09345 [Porticoccaceae bacterium]